MKGYNEAIEYLYKLQHHGIKLGLRNSFRLMSVLGNPQESFRAVHVAGTNGKGSTSAFLASILRSAGHNVGLFTSPHLVSFTERIRVNGVGIKESEVVEITDFIRDAIGGEGIFSPTFFEFVTAMAFYFFRQCRVEWAVVETGMGGRLDATNTLVPEVSVITHIAMDHMQYLGDTLMEIAGEKAGIIKKGVPVVSGSQVREAAEVLSFFSEKKQAALYRYGVDFSFRPVSSGIRETRFDYISYREMKDLTAALAGFFQAENASVAIKTAELLNDPAVNEAVIRNGIAAARWEGRCELFPWRFPILFDGAHNPDAAAALGKVLRDIYLKEFGNLIFIMGMMGDKDIKGFIKTLLPLAATCIFVTLGFERAAKAENLKAAAHEIGFETVTAGTMVSALEIAGGLCGKRDLVVVTGSFYAVGEAKGVIGFDSSLLGLTEFK